MVYLPRKEWAYTWDGGRSRFQSPSRPGKPAQHMGLQALGLGVEQVPVPVSLWRTCPARGAPSPVSRTPCVSPLARG